MKKIIALLAILFVSIGWTMAQSGPKFNFKNSSLTHDFGKVKNGGAVEYYFDFTNTGDKPIVITNVESSCHCTTPKWNKKPVAPGKSDRIKIEFKPDTVGPVTRTVDVTSNAGSVTLTINADVVK